METPKITISDNTIVLETFEVPIVVNEKDEIVKMQELPSGKRREATKKNMKSGLVGNQMQADVDVLGMQISILSKVIVEAPFDSSEDGLSKLPDNVVDYLYSQYQERGTKKSIQEE